MITEEDKKKEEEPIQAGIKQATATSLLRMSSFPMEGLAKVERDIPAYASALRAFEVRLNFLGCKRPERRFYPEDWTITNTVDQFLLMSRSIKGSRAKQITDICKEGVKNPRGVKRFLGGIFGDDDDDYRPSEHRE